MPVWTLKRSLLFYHALWCVSLQALLKFYCVKYIFLKYFFKYIARCFCFLLEVLNYVFICIEILSMTQKGNSLEKSLMFSLILQIWVNLYCNIKPEIWFFFLQYFFWLKRDESFYYKKKTRIRIGLRNVLNKLKRRLFSRLTIIGGQLVLQTS